MKTNTAALQDVEEIADELDVAERLVVQAAAAKAEADADLAAVNARLEAIKVELDAAGPDWRKTQPLFAERREFFDRRAQCEDILAKAGQRLIAATENAGTIRARRGLEKMRADHVQLREQLRENEVSSLTAADKVRELANGRTVLLHKFDGVRAALGQHGPMPDAEPGVAELFDGEAVRAKLTGKYGAIRLDVLGVVIPRVARFG